MIFNKLYDILGRVDLVEFFIVGLRSFFTDVKIGSRVFLPNSLDFLQTFLDLKLLFGIMSEFVDHSAVLNEIKFKNLFECEVLTLLIEFLLYFESKFIPMTGSH